MDLGSNWRLRVCWAVFVLDQEQLWLISQRVGSRFPSCVGSHVFTRFRMISVIQTSLTYPVIVQLGVCGLSSLLFQLTAILGQDPVYWIPKSSEVSISCCTEKQKQQQLMQQGDVSSLGGWRGGVDRDVCACVFGWLKAGWVGWGFAARCQACSWLSGRGATLKSSGASKVGLS